MKTTVEFHRGERTAPRKHRVTICPAEGIARYRDRHQARAGAASIAAGSPGSHADPFSCLACRGWHVDISERATARPLAITRELDRFTEPATRRRRRYYLVDVENPTRGAKASTREVTALWSVLKAQAPGISARDHVVVGAARSVARRYRDAIQAHNVRWVVGADAPDAADRALLNAIDLYRVAHNFDELVIVSGDGAFSDLARRAKGAGLTVHVVTVENPAGRPTLARSLSHAADIHTLIRLHSRSQRQAATRALHAVSAASPPKSRAAA